MLSRFNYSRLRHPDKGLIRAYPQRTSGYSRAQLARLVRQYFDCGRMVQRYAKPQAGFARVYTEADVRLLAEIDTLHGILSGPATKKLMERAYHTFDDARYERLSTISVAHLYNLRKRTGYQRRRQHLDQDPARHLRHRPTAHTRAQQPVRLSALVMWVRGFLNGRHSGRSVLPAGQRYSSCSSFHWKSSRWKVPSVRSVLSNTGICGAMAFSSTIQPSIGDYRDNAGAGRSISACVTSLSATYLPNMCATR